MKHGYWGLHPWAIYALMELAIAWFQYNRNRRGLIALLMVAVMVWLYRVLSMEALREKAEERRVRRAIENWIAREQKQPALQVAFGGADIAVHLACESVTPHPSSLIDVKTGPSTRVPRAFLTIDGSLGNKWHSPNYCAGRLTIDQYY